MVDLMCGPTNLLFFDIPLLYCYTNLNPAIIFCLSSGDMHPFFGTSISPWTSSFFECNSVENFFETLVILLAILLPIKPPVASAAFWIALFEAVFIPSVVDFLALSRSFWPYLLLKFLRFNL